MRKSLLFILIFALMCNSAYAFSGGSGTSADPYQVSTMNDLQDISTDLDAYYIQTADISASGYSYTPMNLQGEYNGNGYTISGLTVVSGSGDDIGLFSQITGATVKNVRLTGVNILGDTNVGGITGYAASGSTIENVYVSGSIRANTRFVGGVAGVLGGGSTLTDSASTASITSYGGHGGGLAGMLISSSSITDSYSTGSVSVDSRYGGGAVGQCYGSGSSVTNTYSTGSVTCPTDAGGLIGAADAGTTVTSSYYDSDTSGQSDTGKGTPKTTVQMQTESTFVGWDFTDTWFMDGYPELEYLAYHGGLGTSAYPYQISTAEQLEDVSLKLNSNFVIINDIDASDTSTWDSGSGFTPIGSFSNEFTGLIDFNGYTVEGLYINRASDFQGLFGGSDGATFEDVSITNANITGSGSVAILSGTDFNSQLTGISYISGNVTGSGTYIGGLFGYHSARNGNTISINQVELDVNVSGDEKVGGCIGEAIASGGTSLISEISTSGTVSGNTKVGGLFGQHTSLDQTTDGYAYIDDSYSNADVSGTSYVGGLIGYNVENGVSINDVENTYARGQVSGSTNVGGLIGDTFGTQTITDSYYDINTTGQTISSGGTGKTTLEMVKKSTFNTWDFIDTWNMQVYPALTFQTVDYSVDPLITSPTNGTTFTTTYPPLSNDYVFQWSEHDGVSSSVYQLAKDENYNTIVASGTITTFSKTVAIESGDYWFRVKYNFDDGTESDYAESIFTVNTTKLDYGTAVQGVVYKTEGGSQTPLPNANVILYNDTFSDTYTTSSNGYYLFNNLANGTYYIQASKDGYEDSTLNIVTLTSGITSTKNIVLEPETAPNYILPHYVEFTVKSLWNTVYPDVTVNVYEGDSATALYTGVTDSSGIVGFELSETIRYRLTAVNAELGINEEMYLYPVASEQNFYVYRSIWDYFTPDDSITQEMELNVQGSEINASHAYVNVTYYDAMTETKNVNISVVEINNDGTQTIIASESFLGSSDIEHSFIIEGYVGNSYLVYFTGNHDTFGDFERSYSVQFTGMKDNFGWSTIWIWIAIAGLIFLAGMFGNADYHSGAIIVVVAGWIMYAMGMFSGFSVVAGLGLASAIAVAAYMSNKAKEEGS